jgi:dCMP deaminase
MVYILTREHLYPYYQDTPAPPTIIRDSYSKEVSLDLYYLRLAHVVGLDRSKDPTTKVGSVLVSADGRGVSTGYNGFPKGVNEASELWERPAKYARAQHSESNNLINSPFDTVGSTMYVTLSPCHSCLGMMINAGISRMVWYGELYHGLNREIWDEWQNHISWTQYTDDPIIEGIKALYA